jgi:hypothetical protein
MNIRVNLKFRGSTRCPGIAATKVEEVYRMCVGGVLQPRLVFFYFFTTG